MCVQKIQTCYMCDNPEDSSEHVPPRVIFPEQKDTKGEDYRKNLITVPSCEIHNSEKSKDDQYLFLVLSMVYEGNEKARKHFSTKGMRTLRRKPQLLSQLQINLTPVLLDFQVTAMFEVDKNRFIKISDQMARGLYYHHYEKKLQKPLDLFYFFGLFDPTSPDFLDRQKKNKQFLNGVIKFLGHHPKYGENKDIFFHQIFEDDVNEFLIIRMVFYEGINVIGYHSIKYMHKMALTMRGP